MAVKKRPTTSPNGKTAASTPSKRLMRSDEEKIRIVRQIMASANQTAEFKRLGIYPNQYYDWKKAFADKLGLIGKGPGSIAESLRSRLPRGTLDRAASDTRSLADEARAFLHGKTKLLEQLKSQREELDELITQLDA